MRSREDAVDEHPNVALLKRIYARDRATFFRMVTPDYACHTPGASQVAGTVRGAEGMRAHIEQGQALTGGTFRVTHQGHFLADDHHGLVPVRLTGERLGRRLDIAAFGIWRFADGRIAEHWENPLDIPAFDAFWA
jgi:ketosteroid isomerase-like protein